ncbi:MAG: hypothetical protein HY815_22570 [Candidatus Riflebacteria bacterium]|nr:hypothetical protein [Candidatus Riflebacteria bacterium]
MKLYDELRAVVDALTRANVPFAICGGLAVALHGYVRATKDIDLVVLEADVDQARSSVKAVGFSLAALPMTFDKGTPRERVVHRISKIEGDDHLVLDLIVVSPDRLGDVWADRQAIEWQGVRLDVVSRRGLYRMKRDAGRDQDLLDLKNLGLEEEPDSA